MTWAMVQKHGPYPGCRSCHVLPGGHSDACRPRFERIWADVESIKAMEEAEKDARQASSSATVSPSVTQPAMWDMARLSRPVHQAS